MFGTKYYDDNLWQNLMKIADKKHRTNVQWHVYQTLTRENMLTDHVYSG